ncbi:MAG: radical SAM family heme chaperone HemW [Mycobacteriales bacterium]
MPALLPDGEPVPADGALPAPALAALRRDHSASVTASRATDAFGVYVHVPYCATRCGYCDFNTYTPAELGIVTTGQQGGGAAAPRENPKPPQAAGSDIDSYLSAVLAEIEHAAVVLDPAGEHGLPAIDTVFFGGGTPTLLPSSHLAAIVARLDAVFGLAPGAEVSTEANPESVDSAGLAAFVEAGFTRISLGMQSAATAVLATLDRRHTPGAAVAAVAQARAAGFCHVNLDLIYGTPGETDADWRASLSAVVAAEVDHVSAYSLTVEPGTALARRVKTGVLTPPDDDVMADRYHVAEQMLGEAGLSWYEISNWATNPAARCRHNQLYWRGGSWWGFGPGAHSHVGGVRWWNVKHPAAYAARLAAGVSPAQAREVLTVAQRRTEDVMLRLRLVTGFPLEELDDRGRHGAQRACGDGLLEPAAHRSGRAVLTLRGRLLADRVVGLLSP